MAFEKGWAVLRTIIAQLVVMTASLADNANAARALCRTGEAIARRILLARALALPLPRLSPLTRRAREALARAARRKRLDPCDVRYRPPAEPRALFRLAEPLAGFPAPAGSTTRHRRLMSNQTIAQYGVLTVRTFSTHGDPSLPPIRADGRPVAPAPSVADTASLDRRITALVDLAERPGAHVRRMSRWIARQRVERHGRLSPLRPGRAPGQVMDRRRRSFEQERLSDMHHLAHRALSQARAPPQPFA